MGEFLPADSNMKPYSSKYMRRLEHFDQEIIIISPIADKWDVVTFRKTHHISYVIPFHMLLFTFSYYVHIILE